MIRSGSALLHRRITTSGQVGWCVVVLPKCPRRCLASPVPLPPEMITVAVRWYLLYGLSYRDVEELLAERGIEVDHVTVCRSVQRFTA